MLIVAFLGTKITKEYFLLTPSTPNSLGSVHGNTPATSLEWEVDVGVAVSGRGSVGGRGIGIWYTRSQIFENTDGPMGAPSMWDGIGVILDTVKGEVLFCSRFSSFVILRISISSLAILHPPLLSVSAYCQSPFISDLIGMKNFNRPTHAFSSPPDTF